MKLEFNQGVPLGCIEWLWVNVGPGNLGPGTMIRNYTRDGDQWFYERVEVEIRSTNPEHDSNTKYVPTITVKDEKLAMLFVLRWS